MKFNGPPPRELHLDEEVVLESGRWRGGGWEGEDEKDLLPNDSSVSSNYSVMKNVHLWQLIHKSATVIFHKTRDIIPLHSFKLYTGHDPDGWLVLQRSTGSAWLSRLRPLQGHIGAFIYPTRWSVAMSLLLNPNCVRSITQFCRQSHTTKRLRGPNVLSLFICQQSS